MSFFVWIFPYRKVCVLSVRCWWIGGNQTFTTLISVIAIPNILYSLDLNTVPTSMRSEKKYSHFTFCRMVDLNEAFFFSHVINSHLNRSSNHALQMQEPFIRLWMQQKISRSRQNSSIRQHFDAKVNCSTSTVWRSLSSTEEKCYTLYWNIGRWMIIW